MMRWGKSVINTNVGSTSIIIQKRKEKPQNLAEGPSVSIHPTQSSSTSKMATLSDAQRESAIQVVSPKDQQKFHLISTVASFISKDGALLEQALLQREIGNPKFDFLRWQSEPLPHNADNNNSDHIFYRWRVYSFCQGDGFNTWRTEPFTMVQGGRLWIPPPIDAEAARREEEAEREKEAAILRQKQERKFRNARRDYMTGRQLEQIRKGGPDGGAELDPADLQELDRLFRQELCASRQAICEAMAFCFEKSGAAKQISAKMEALLKEPGPSVRVEILVARLYLLSDVLFNSQQPGVKNAFLYRDAIERMTPGIFESLGRHGKGQLGRMTMNKLVSAVRTVLNAWADWNVFNQHFLDELFARFEGREIPENDAESTEVNENSGEAIADHDETAAAEETAQSIVREVAQGKWTTVSKDDEGHLVEDTIEVQDATSADKEAAAGEGEGATSGTGDDENDADGEPLEDESERDDADGEPLEEEEEEHDDADGEPIDDEEEGSGEEDADGVPMEEGEGNEVDGQPL